MSTETVAPLNDPSLPASTDIAGSIAAEHATVGAVVQAAARIQDEVLAVVRDADFLDPRCRFVVGIARRMRSEELPVDPLLLCGFVQRNGLLKGAPRMHLASWLSEVASAAPCLASASYYAELVVEEAARTAARYAGRAITAAADDGSLADLRAVAVAELAAVTAAIERVGGGVNV